MSYFGTDPGDLTPDDMHGREPVSAAARPSEEDETPLTIVQRSVLAGIARECLADVAKTRQMFPRATLTAETVLAQRCRDILRYEATIQELEARRAAPVQEEATPTLDAEKLTQEFWYAVAEASLYPPST